MVMVYDNRKKVDQESGEIASTLEVERVRSDIRLIFTEYLMYDERTTFIWLPLSSAKKLLRALEIEICKEAQIDK